MKTPSINSRPCDGLDKEEFFDVYCQFKPDATRDEYERDWKEFQELKAEHLRKKAIQ